MRRVVLMGAVLVLFGACVAVAAGSPPATRTLGVRPASGTAHSVFRVRLTSVVTTPDRRPIAYRATVALLAHHPRGCVSTRAAVAMLSARTIALSPGSRGSAWCRGRYRGTVVVEETQRCGPIVARTDAQNQIVCPLVVRPAAVGGPVTGPGTTTTATPTATTPTTPTLPSAPGTPEELGSFSFVVR